MPYSGGWMEQPGGMVPRASALLNIYDAHVSWQRADSWAEWLFRNPSYWKVIQNVITIREAYG